jgi:hypothetical protein
MSSRAIANGWPLGAGNPPPVPKTPLPVPLPDGTFANSTLVFANTLAFYGPLLEIQQRLLTLGMSLAAIDFGNGPNTGDSIYAALVKLQNGIAAVENPASNRPFFTDPFFADGMFARS